MKMFFTLALLFLTLNLQAQSMTASVTLSPAGSFEVETKSIIGFVQKKGDKLMATNIRIPVRNLATKNDTRDDHLKDKLEYKTHHNIVVEKAVAAKNKGNALIKIRKVTKKVPFTYRENGSKVDVEFKINLEEFGITGINYMGVGVDKIVNIKATLPVK